MALVPVIQPPIMRLLTTREERLIRMKPPRAVSKLEKILFPLIGLLGNHLYFTKFTSSAGHALFWQPAEGIGGNQAAG